MKLKKKWVYFSMISPFLLLLVSCILIPKQRNIYFLKASHQPKIVYEEEEFSLFLVPIKLNTFIGQSKSTIPSFVDGNQVVLDPNSEWAMPLSENISIVFLKYFYQLFPKSNFYHDFNSFSHSDYQLRLNFYYLNPYGKEQFYIMVNWQIFEKNTEELILNELFEEKVHLKSQSMDTKASIYEDLLYQLVVRISKKIYEHRQFISK